MKTARHAALVRGDDEGLHVRHFPTASAAAKASQAREIAPEPGLRSTLLARKIGVHPRTLRRAHDRGELPGIKHGERLLIIPRRVCRLVMTHGLLGVAGMIKRGEL